MNTDMQELIIRTEGHARNTQMKSIFNDKELRILKDVGIFPTDTIAHVLTHVAMGQYRRLSYQTRITVAGEEKIKVGRRVESFSRSFGRITSVNYSYFTVNFPYLTGEDCLYPCDDYGTLKFLDEDGYEIK